MKKLLSFAILLCVGLSMNADIRVISNVKLGNGYFPRFADAETITYLNAETASYRKTASDAAIRVDNENLDLNLYRNGEKVVLNPHGDANYIWVSLSPNQEMILFHTQHGTAICDLNGKEIINLGSDINAPVWYGNDYVVGMDDEHDGYHNIASSIVMASIDGTVFEHLTSPEDMGIFPNVDAKTGRIVYCTDGGDIRMIQLNLTEEPIRNEMPRLVRELDGSLLDKMQMQAKKASSTNPADYKIYINPGHGGYDSDDRLMYIYPIFDGQTVREGYTREQSFWESQSNLDKGMRLDTMLHDLGFQTMMSRVTNTTADDKSLYGIVCEANDYGADFMLSIHSNAGNPSNFILQIHSGITPGDPYGLGGYSDVVPQEICDEARAVTTRMGNNQYMNQVSCWSHVPNISGDKTFARTIMGWSNGYGVLRWLRVPGTISEGMMHDYLPETYRLMNMDYKRQESFYFAKTFIEHFCGKELPYGAIGGKIHDVYQEQTFPNYKPRKNTRDVLRPINRGVVELWQNDQLVDTYVTDTMYNGCYYFWNLQPGTYTVKAKPDGYYPQEQTLEVKNNEISYGIFALSMARQTPPEVIDYSPKVAAGEEVLVSTTVSISFNWDMEVEATAAALEITPAVEGTVTFEDDNHKLRFTPATRFEPGVTYTVTLGTGACHPDTTFDNHLKEPFSFSFTTSNRGSVSVVQTYPAVGETNVPLTPSFIAVFDATIVNASVRSNVAVLDADGNKLAVNTRSYKYNAAPEPYGYAAFELTSPLQPNTDYSFVLYPNIKDKEGILLNETYEIPFRTGEEGTPALPLVHDMETKFFEGDKENSTDVESVNTLCYKNKKYAGTYSNQCSYVFAAEGGEARFKVTNPTLIVSNNVSKLGMYVFSDCSYNTLYVHYGVDGDNQFVKVCDFDFAGWRYCELDLSVLPAGIDYQLMGLKLVGGSNLLSGSGAFYIDNVHAEYVQSGPGANVENLINPSLDNKVIENGYLYILLNGHRYNAQGATIK